LSSQTTTVQINVPVLLFCVALALFTGVLFGLAPAWQLSRAEFTGVKEASTRTSTGGVRSRHTHNVLIATQLALTIVLLAGAGVATEGLFRLMHVPLGYDPQKTLDVDIPLHQNTYMSWEARAAYFRRLQSEVATIPEVTGVVNSSNATPPTNGMEERFEVRGELLRSERQARLNFVSANYFSTLHIPLSRGQIWNGAEDSRGLRMAVINEAMAQRYWPRGNAVGSTIRMPGLHGRPPYGLTAPHSDDWFQVMGVVADAKNDGLTAAVKPAVYVPYTFFMDMGVDLLVRARVTPSSILHSIREKVRTVDSDQQVGGYAPTLEELIAIQPDWKQEQLVSFLFGGFAFLALVLAMAGLYSVVSYEVAQRTKEFGIRMALGARRRDVLRAVLRSTLGSVTGGTCAGSTMIVVLHSVMGQWTAVGTNQSLLVVCTVLLVLGMATLACLPPVFRAASIEPIAALRRE
jgi:predicted permease